ncbi:HTH gntR-type domain-containing protein [Planctomycetales bacterium 10988]|nr:HTH gntR-type domain-containing protein [Planctomycetales bacterium 10988]
MAVSEGIVDLAEQIESDIRARALAVGSPYDTTAETARRFAVNTSKANRALQLLANRGVIVRRQRSGTVVGRIDQGRTQQTLSRLHVIVDESAVRTERLLDDGILIGLQGQLPKTRLQQHFIPGLDRRQFIQEIVGDALKSNGKDGFVLIRSPVEIQRVLADSGLPTVVYGGLHPSVEGVASLDRDQRQIGIELAKYALQKKCSKFVCLLRSEIGPGDRYFARGLIETLEYAKVSINDLSWEWLTSDDALVRAVVEEHLADRRKLAFLCRNEYLASQTQAAIDGSAKRRSRPVVVMADCYRVRREEARFPIPWPAWTAQEVGTELGRLLLAQTQKESLDRSNAESLIPVLPILERSLR